MARAKVTKCKYYVNFEDVPLKEFMMRNTANAIRLREDLIGAIREKEETNKKHKKNIEKIVDKIKKEFKETNENNEEFASNEASKGVEDPISSPKEWKERDNILFDTIIDNDIAEEMVRFAENIRKGNKSEIISNLE